MELSLNQLLGMERGPVTYNQNYLLTLVTKVIPYLREDIYQIKDMSDSLAQSIKQKPDKKLVEKAFIELLAFYNYSIFFNMLFIKTQEQNSEADFLLESIAVTSEDIITEIFPDGFDNLELIAKRNLHFLDITSVLMRTNEVDFIQQIALAMVSNISKKHKNDEEVFKPVYEWAADIFATYFEIFREIHRIFEHEEEPPAEINPEEVVAEIKSHIPIFVKTTDALIKYFTDQGVKVSKHPTFKITGVTGPDENGEIMCKVGSTLKNALYFPLSGLEFEGILVPDIIEQYVSQKRPIKIENVYQFKITLQGIKPPIWRKILIPDNFTFYQMHSAIQDAMGWDDSHLYAFHIIDPRSGRDVEIGMPDQDFGDRVKSAKTAKISDYFTLKNKGAFYEYDFGDDWQHKIALEKILPAKEGEKYPVCIDGKRACPPEDVGGVYSYVEFLDILKDPNHEDYEESIEWAGEDFDPELFDPKSVVFH